MPETYPDVIIGYLVDDRFECLACSTAILDASNTYQNRGPCPVYRVNIGIYSQQCSVCKELVVRGLAKADGSGPLNLFDV